MAQASLTRCLLHLPLSVGLVLGEINVRAPIGACQFSMTLKFLLVIFSL
jgi:hypothetical protein